MEQSKQNKQILSRDRERYYKFGLSKFIYSKWIQGN